jgi:hypothetical protein
MARRPALVELSFLVTEVSNEWSARCTDLYLTTDNTHTRETSIPPAGFEPAIPVSERPQTYALDRAVTEIGVHVFQVQEFITLFIYLLTYLLQEVESILRS